MGGDKIIIEKEIDEDDDNEDGNNILEFDCDEIPHY